jgi:hypothetical protein
MAQAMAHTTATFAPHRLFSSSSFLGDIGFD